MLVTLLGLVSDVNGMSLDGNMNNQNRRPDVCEPGSLCDMSKRYDEVRDRANRYGMTNPDSMSLYSQAEEENAGAYQLIDPEFAWWTFVAATATMSKAIAVEECFRATENQPGVFDESNLDVSTTHGHRPFSY